MSENIAPARHPVSAFLRHYSPALVAFAASRILVLAIIFLSSHVIRSSDLEPPRAMITVLTHWDGAWYMSVAQQGYNYIPGQQSNMAFFPFYPLLVWLADQIVPDIRMAAVLVSHVLFLVAALLFQRLVELDYNRRIVRASLYFLMFTPVSFYFSSAYSESTFLCLAVGCLLAARLRYWLIAGLCGMLLTATRNIGFFIAVPLFMEYVRQMWRPEIGIRSLIHWRVLLLGLVPLGLIAFMAYCYGRYDDPFAYVHASAAWGRKLASPIHAIATIGTAPLFYALFFGGALVIPVVLWIAGFWLKVRLEYLVFTGMLLLIYVSANNAEGMPRFVVVLFPLFIVLGVLSVRFEKLYEPLLAASIAAFTLGTILTANGYWIT